MTIEEAILCLKGIKNIGRDMLTEQKDFQECLDMAIKALEQERIRSAEITQYRHDCEKLMEENERLKKAIEQEPCGECINRQAVIDALNKTSGIRGDALKALYDLTPVTPQPKTGHWIKSRDSYGNNHFTCPFCENDIATKSDTWIDNYCSNCGANLLSTDSERE